MQCPSEPERSFQEQVKSLKPGKLVGMVPDTRFLAMSKLMPAAKAPSTFKAATQGTDGCQSSGVREKSCMRQALSGRRTNVQQLTCKIDLSSSFYYLFFSFVLLELKPFVLKGKVPGEKLMKKCENLWKSVKIMKRFCPLVVAL